MTEAVVENAELQKAGQKAFRIERAPDGIACLYFDTPEEKVNKLTSAVLVELESVVKEIAQDSSIKAVVLMSGKEDSSAFIAGADINEIKDVTYPAEATTKARQAQEIFNRLANLPQPVIAVVHGACLGGGTELILACDFRIATDDPKTSIGLPEVRLGIIPGFGGTQRLPRLIGIRKALDLILTGKTVDARKAAKLGLVDHLVPLSLLRDQVLEFTRDILEKGGKNAPRRRRSRGLLGWLLEGNHLGRRLIRRFVTRDLEKKAGEHYAAPFKALDAVLTGYERTLEAGLDYESDLVGQLVASSTSKNLISIFFDSEKLRRPDGPTDGPTDSPTRGAEGRAASASEPGCAWAKSSRRVAVLGAGVMGGSIAALLSRKGYHVRLKDIQGAALTSGLKQARKSFDQLVKRRRMTTSERDNCLCAISTTTTATGFGEAEVVIEAVVEEMEIKKKVLQEIEPLLGDDAVFATNTSALSVTELAAAAGSPERVAGMHFFNPVHRMPLVEIVYGEKTSQETLEKVEALTRELGKYPLRVKDGPGFLVNRLLTPYLNEAAFLFEEGFGMEAIDRRAVAFGLPMGPYALIDEVGLDVAKKVARHLHVEFGPRFAPAELLGQLAEKEKLLGKKGGAGFYVHGGGRKKPRPNIDALSYGGKGTRPDEPEQWMRRMLYPMVNEAARCLEEGIVESAWQVDIGMIFGTGFPPFRGGLLRWADGVGLTKILEALETLTEQYAGKGGERYEPSAFLKKLVADDAGFHSSAS